jgi:RNA polymerase primary sigma factor
MDDNLSPFDELESGHDDLDITGEDAAADETIEEEADGFDAEEDAEEEEAEEEENGHANRPEIDDHSDDAIKLYLKEIQKTTLLTAEQERELARRISEGSADSF